MSASASLKIEIAGGGKKFFRQWIFRHLALEISPGEKLVVTGPNGSGKSTFLQVISGYESLSEGRIRYWQNGMEVLREDVFAHISIAAPYLDMVEEFTLEEILRFHFQFKKPLPGADLKMLPELMMLGDARNKVYRYFSSGMKQRTKLALAMLSDVSMILLDEPLSNLDRESTVWYRDLAEKYLQDKTVVVCSNQNEAEYSFCNRHLNILNLNIQSL